ncbi:MAG: hypothetical protein ACJAQT_000724 [Akkermansiaceae bacterium]
MAPTLLLNQAPNQASASFRSFSGQIPIPSSSRPINHVPPKKKTAKKKTAKKAASKNAPTTTLIPDQLVIRLRCGNIILDADIAELYGVETKAPNRAVKRNTERFPADFMFQLTEDEFENLKCQTGTSSLKSQSVTSSSHGGRRTLPYPFTEQGVAMLSSVLRSPRAVEVNIAIMRTFVQLRTLMQSNNLLAEKIEKMEKKYDQNFQIVFDAIKQVITADQAPKCKIGFNQGSK